MQRKRWRPPPPVPKDRGQRQDPCQRAQRAGSSHNPQGSSSRDQQPACIYTCAGSPGRQVASSCLGGGSIPFRRGEPSTKCPRAVKPGGDVKALARGPKETSSRDRIAHTSCPNQDPQYAGVHPEGFTLYTPASMPGASLMRLDAGHIRYLTTEELNELRDRAHRSDPDDDRAFAEHCACERASLVEASNPSLAHAALGLS